MNVNRLCGSGLQAIVSAAQGFALCEQVIAVAGGAESMSNAPHLVLTGKGEKLKGQALPADFPEGTRVHADLGEFADWLLAQPDSTHKHHKNGVKA